MKKKVPGQLQHSRMLEAHVVCKRPQEDGRSVGDQDQTLEERVT